MRRRAWSQLTARARCIHCAWEKTSRAAQPKSHEFVVRYARRHAETYGHEVEVGVEKLVIYRGPRRHVPPARRRWRAA